MTTDAERQRCIAIVRNEMESNSDDPFVVALLRRILNRIIIGE